MQEYTLEEVGAHKSKTDLWVTIHGKVYDVSEYVKDHPGGADVLVDVAGQDATAAYEDVGHSEDANEILETFLIGTLKDAVEYKARQTVRVVQDSPAQPPPKASSGAVRTLGLTASSLLSLYLASNSIRKYLNPNDFTKMLPGLDKLSSLKLSGVFLPQGGFANGVAVTACACAILGSIIASRLSKLTQIESGFTKYPPHIKRNPIYKQDPHLIPGFLQPKEYRPLPLVAKEALSPNVYRFVFQLPRKSDVIGLPIGQHVAIKATIDGQTVSRSYTPTSNNLDLGTLELVIKCYPDGLLTGKYLANLEVGDKVLFRGPKGAMRYKKGLCKKIGMIAGGTGITPMYQLIRAICENDRDTTEIHLIYANRSEEDILLREELEEFASSYPNTLKIWYMLDHPPQDWKYGKGYVTKDVMRQILPAPSPESRIMLCGPPGMVNASKKGLAELGYQAPGSVAKMTDQIFCF
ncbi:cytochrome b5 [Aspergillus campestris IBT 28561]|uniref:Cytochrome b5 n=1 Tax=Aspergillus campestris (strain IBT 28561) TaxID=1392248 RepID=A0A2I1CRV8_ASPC2|nr:cytochrome b5 [Aspergillus campestris IBT 28561]PKY00360.1 cytochrome b5 [Aspergillus campestris IBT 28561]